MIDTEILKQINKSPEKPQVLNKIEDSESDMDSDAGEAGSESPDEEMETDKSKANPGWADAMKKILSTKKPKRKKTIVLSKAKKLNEVVPKEEIPFEIQDPDGVVKKEQIVKEEKFKVELKKQKRKDPHLGIRIKPTILDREKESLLKKIATKGVVQLFNVVRQQQCDIDKKLEEAGPLERKREKVLKNIDKKAFLDVLMGGTKSIAIEKSEDEKKEESYEQDSNKNNEKIWSVLKDDFAMGAKMKDWNKGGESSDDSSSPEGMDSD